jgi:hypothetical protein
VPEQRGDHAGDDGKASEVPAKGGPRGHGEWDMQTRPDGPVENERDGGDEIAKDDADDGFAPAERSISPTLVTCEGPGSYQVNPTAMMAAGASQPCAFKASENQKPSMVHGPQTRRSGGVTSISMLVLCGP